MSNPIKNSYWYNLDFIARDKSVIEYNNDEERIADMHRIEYNKERDAPYKAREAWSRFNQYSI